MADHNQEFPYEEIRKESGDYFSSVYEALMLNPGKTTANVWSVTESENTFTYGPSRHYINLLGYVVTEETHDEDTYYHESLDLEE